MDAVDRGEVPTLVVAHKDRLARFDLAIVRTYSCRLDGLRRYDEDLGKADLTTGGGR